jgi:hypothetical protein
MGKIGDLFVRLGLKSDDYKKGMANAKKETTTFSQDLQKMKGKAVAVFAAIGTAVAVFAREFASHTNTIGDAWAHTMSAMQASYHSVIADMSNYKPDFSSFRNFFKNEWEWIRKTIFNAKDAGAAAKEMSAAFDAEFELVNSVRLQRQQVQQELNELYIKMRDTTLDPSTRKAAGERFRELLQPIADAEVRVYGNMLKEAVSAWQAGNELDREYSTQELTEFFSKIGTEYEKMQKKFPDLMRVYETRKGDAQNQIIFDTISKLQTAANQMSEIDKLLSRTELSINKQIADAAGTGRVEIPALPALGNILGSAQLGTERGIGADNYYADLMASNQEYLDWYAGMVQTMQELNYVLEDSIISATQNGLQAFTDMLFGLEDAGMEEILAAFIAPFGDTLKQMGSMIMAEGIAMEAFKNSFSNPYAAIAAGAALIAIGSAVSSGLQRLTANPAGGGSSSSYGSGSSSYGKAENYESTLTVNVVGTISGSDIALSLDRTKKNSRR